MPTSRIGPARAWPSRWRWTGRLSPLYPAPDGSGKRYLEAREGVSYAVRLDNRTGERVGVVLTVDGLNAISGVQETPQPWGAHERMYILDPWGSTTVRGWRTSLAEVRRFTFVDERSSYAARSGKANGKMGWIEIAVYRERRPVARQPWEPRLRGDAGSENESSKDATGRPAPPATMLPAPEARAEGSRRDAPRAPTLRVVSGHGLGRRHRRSGRAGLLRPAAAALGGHHGPLRVRASPPGPRDPPPPLLEPRPPSRSRERRRLRPAARVVRLRGCRRSG